MALRPEISIPAALATGAVVMVVYDHALPSIADTRVGGQYDPHLDSSERQAAWTSAAVVGGVSLIAKDPTIFVVGGAMIVALSWWHRHANCVNPDSGKVGPVSPVRTPDQYEYGN
jgi:hypothetical protein